MTTNAMSCELFGERLAAYLEHETDDATRALLERHAVTCADCGALLADIRKLRVDAANLPELTPSRDLWSGIAARIEAPVVAIGARRADQPRSSGSSRWTRVALIAASLVLAAGVGYFAAALRHGTGAPIQVASVPRIDSSAPDASVDTVQPASGFVPQAPGTHQPRALPVSNPSERSVSAQLAVATLNADYDREIARLRAIIEQRRNQLDPVTVAIIEKNLQVIDTAIVQCKKAIARDPASRFLIESLNQSLQTKVELMRTTALLPSRT